MTLADNTTIMNQIKQYIESKEYGKPILLADVAREFTDENEEIKKTRNTISVYLNRLVRNNELKKFNNGIFYKTKKNTFGEIPIDYEDLIKNIYFYDAEKENIIGYRIGTNVLANIGITNNLENIMEIVTNNFNKRKVLDTINQNIYLKKPILEVNNDNYMYLQLLDTVKEISKYYLTNEQVGEKLAGYMDKNRIEVDKLFKIAKKYYNKKTTKNLIDLLAM